MNFIKKFFTSVFILCGMTAGLVSCSAKKNCTPEFVKDMKLVWSDEFNGESDAPDPANWSYKEGANGWGNGELQNYTDSRENSYVSKGTLKITAKKGEFQKWTSARLFSQQKMSFTYGYLEFKAKLPAQKGSWPALWMLPDDSSYGTWPRSGEIDVMEASKNVWGSKVYGTVHCYAGSGGNPVMSVGRDIKKMDKKWHTYAVNWTPEGITWYFDGEVLSEYRNPHNDEDGWMAWPFDRNFHIIMNVAMGGTLGGDIDPKLNECTMEVDYVRLYQ